MVCHVLTKARKLHDSGDPFGCSKRSAVPVRCCWIPGERKRCNLSKNYKKRDARANITLRPLSFLPYPSHPVSLSPKPVPRATIVGCCSVEAVLGDLELLREIFMRVDGAADLVRASAVSPTWCAAAKLPGFLRAFRGKVGPPIIGYAVEFDHILWNFSCYFGFPGIGNGLAQASQTVAQHFLDPDRSIVALASGDSGLMAREQLPNPSYMVIQPGGSPGRWARPWLCPLRWPRRRPTPGGTSRRWAASTGSSYRIRPSATT